MNDQLVEGIWKESGASPEYLEAMRLVLLNQDEANGDSTPRLSLPVLCCRAAGGDPMWVGDISRAWTILYDAAHLLDGIQDQDQLDPWIQEMGAAAAINVASGLVISGLAVLNQFQRSLDYNPAATEICNRFYSVGLRMSGGQHLDLINHRPGVEEWFEIAEAKSGAFFGLACWAGARLATGDIPRLDGFWGFGKHLGLLLQLHDDLADLGDLKAGVKGKPLNWITRSLPVAYALEFFPEKIKERLLEKLGAPACNVEARQDVFNLLDQSGAGLFLKVEIERNQELARAALERARPEPTEVDELSSIIYRFTVEAKTE